MTAETFAAPDFVDEDVDTSTGEPDEDVTLDEEPDIEPDEDVEGDSPSDGAAKGASQARRPNRAAIRRVANKTVEVFEADNRTVEIAASILGSGTGTAEIATAIMCADRGVAEPIRDLNMIAESDPFEAGVNAAALSRDRLKAVWALLGALGVGGKSALPAAQGKAGLAVAKVVFGLDDVTKAEIEAVATLLKRG